MGQEESERSFRSAGQVWQQGQTVYFNLGCTLKSPGEVFKNTDTCIPPSVIHVVGVSVVSNTGLWCSLGGGFRCQGLRAMGTEGLLVK